MAFHTVYFSLTMEGDSDVVVYHNVENTRIFKEKELQSFDVSVDLAPGIEFLIQSYPDYIKINSLPLENAEMQVIVKLCCMGFLLFKTCLFQLELCNLLYDKGLLITEQPLKPLT